MVLASSLMIINSWQIYKFAISITATYWEKIIMVYGFYLWRDHHAQTLFTFLSTQ